MSNGQQEGMRSCEDGERNDCEGPVEIFKEVDKRCVQRVEEEHCTALRCTKHPTQYAVALKRSTTSTQYPFHHLPHETVHYSTTVLYPIPHHTTH